MTAATPAATGLAARRLCEFQVAKLPLRPSIVLPAAGPGA
jgi:hypothetical protein